MPKLVIASRKSDLARSQAQHIAKLIQSVHPQLKIELLYRESLGDKNQHDPLWKMPEKGVFTQDFREDLLNRKIDLVVHSWKDLPTEMSAETKIFGSTPRADQRDVLLFKKHTLAKGKKSTITLLTSSPRRFYNLSLGLKELLPKTLDVKELSFKDIRGNVPTRIKKFLLDENADGLVLAKAGLDRLLGATEDEYASTNFELRSALDELRFMVIPLSINPSAAAQGALAVEGLIHRPDLEDLLQPIMCPRTTTFVQVERDILKSYGGGCHQKIGVSIIDHHFGPVLSLKGKTEAGDSLDVYGPLKEYLETQPHRLSSEKTKWIKNKINQFADSSCWDDSMDSELIHAAKINACFPESKNQTPKLFSRMGIMADFETLRMSPLVVSRANALPKEFVPGADQILWTSGLDTWTSLSDRGCWVSGSFDSLGETFELCSPRLHFLSPTNEGRFIKLTHSKSQLYPKNFKGVVATYHLEKVSDEDLDHLKKEISGKKWFFWMSGSAFLEALSICPEIIDAYHSCGPGNTHEVLQAHLSSEKINIYMSYKAWLNKIEQLKIKEV